MENERVDTGRGNKSYLARLNSKTRPRLQPSLGTWDNQLCAHITAASPACFSGHLFSIVNTFRDMVPPRAEVVVRVVFVSPLSFFYLFKCYCF